MLVYGVELVCVIYNVWLDSVASVELFHEVALEEPLVEHDQRLILNLRDGNGCFACQRVVFGHTEYRFALTEGNDGKILRNVKIGGDNDHIQKFVAQLLQKIQRAMFHCFQNDIGILLLQSFVKLGEPEGADHGR